MADHRRLVTVDQTLQGRTRATVFGDGEVERLPEHLRVSELLLDVLARGAEQAVERTLDVIGRDDDEPPSSEVRREVHRLLRKAGVAVTEQHDGERAAGGRGSARMRVDLILDLL